MARLEKEAWRKIGTRSCGLVKLPIKLYEYIEYPLQQVSPVSVIPASVASYWDWLEAASGGAPNSISLIVDLEPQLVPSLSPLAPASFMLKRRRAPRMESRDGLARTFKIYVNSALDSNVKLTTIWKTLTRITLCISREVRWNCQAILNLAHARQEVNDLVSHKDLDESSGVHSRLCLPQSGRFIDGQWHEKQPVYRWGWPAVGEYLSQQIKRLIYQDSALSITGEPLPKQ